ncbi:MAG: hypothetical protein U5K56_00640 [Halioglobus sp.]|nr:hypothetical protein [Halioglobus sp.]
MIAADILIDIPESLLQLPQLLRVALGQVPAFGDVPGQGVLLRVVMRARYGNAAADVSS